MWMWDLHGQIQYICRLHSLSYIRFMYAEPLWGCFRAGCGLRAAKWIGRDQNEAAYVTVEWRVESPLELCRDATRRGGDHNYVCKLLFTPAAFPLTGPHALRLDQITVCSTQQTILRIQLRVGLHTEHTCAFTRTHTHAHKVNLIKSVEASRRNWPPFTLSKHSEGKDGSALPTAQTMIPFSQLPQ